MIQRLLLIIAALAATAAAAVVTIVAAAMAVFALAKPWTGDAGAAAIVAAIFALLIGIIAALAAVRARGKQRARKLESANLTGRLTELAKAKPWAAAGVAVATAALAARNPVAIAAVARVIFDSMNKRKATKR